MPDESFRILSRSQHLDDDFALRVIEIDRQAPLSQHAHEFQELVLVVDGRGEHQTGEESYELNAGDVFVIEPGRAHGYGGDGGLHIYNVIYEAQSLALPLRDLRAMAGYHALFTLEPRYRRDHVFRSRLQLSRRDLARARTIVENMRDEIAGRRPGFRSAATADLLRLFVLLSRCYESQSDAEASRSLLRIGEAIGYLETHHEHKVTVPELARRVHMSERNLQRAFRRATGKSVIQYLLDLRIRRAAWLLEQQDLRISDIAFHVGFEDSNYFSRQFRTVMGCSPREYRRTRCAR